MYIPVLYVEVFVEERFEGFNLFRLHGMRRNDTRSVIPLFLEGCIWLTISSLGNLRCEI